MRWNLRRPAARACGKIRLHRRCAFPYNLPPYRRYGRFPFREDLPVNSDRYLFTSESVSMGHPDKVADQISDAVLDFCLSHDPTSRVACETLVTTNLAVVAGEITTKAPLTVGAIQKLTRETIEQIGYTDPEMEFTADT